MPTARRPVRILVVDDEEIVRRFVARALRGVGYDVTVASSGAEVLQMVEDEGACDLFVIDVLMPQMRGDELARRLRQRHPDAKILYLTGHSGQLFEDRDALWENEAFIEKPVTLNGLLEAVSFSLRGARLRP